MATGKLTVPGTKIDMFGKHVQLYMLRPHMTPYIIGFTSSINISFLSSKNFSMFSLYGSSFSVYQAPFVREKHEIMIRIHNFQI